MNLSIVDIESRQVRRLTAGPDEESSPHWSPDGSRIAFVRRHATLMPDNVCWITPDRSRERCTAALPDIESVIGWLDAETVLFTGGRSGKESGLATLDLRDNRVDMLVPNGIGRALLSSDGQWVACVCSFPGMADRINRWSVFPTRQPEQHRGIATGLDTTARSAFWYPGTIPRWIAGIHITRPPDSIAVDAQFRMSAAAVASDGMQMTAPEAVLSWRSLDPTIATVDSTTGYLHPLRRGVARIEVSAGGWRRDSTRLTIAGPSSRATTVEPWDTSWRERWTPFGYAPLPQVIPATAIGRAFTPNGDGTYDNGAYSRAQYPGKEGLGIEATVQSPVNRPNAQRFSLMITAIAQATPSGPAGVGCSVRNPSGDGWSYLHYMGVTDAILPVADELTSDKPYRVRLQLFPDGTCGTAINGHARHRSKLQVRPELMYSFMIKGESVGTQILVGPLTMWRGVRGDMDWDALTRDTTAAGQRIKRP